MRTHLIGLSCPPGARVVPPAHQHAGGGGEAGHGDSLALGVVRQALYQQERGRRHAWLNSLSMCAPSPDCTYRTRQLEMHIESSSPVLTRWPLLT